MTTAKTKAKSGKSQKTNNCCENQKYILMYILTKITTYYKIMCLKVSQNKNMCIN